MDVAGSARRTCSGSRGGRTVLRTSAGRWRRGRRGQGRRESERGDLAPDLKHGPSGQVLDWLSCANLTGGAFLGSAASAGLAVAAAPAIPIIDCHIHLFDQTRPQGAPYSGGPRNSLPALPARYRKLAGPLGIVGAIEVEASPWLEDNLWVLEVEQPESMMLGMIGNLRPEKPEFGEYLERFHRNKLFLGIRYGNLWGYSLVEQVSNPAFVAGLKLLQQAGLAIDTANPQPDLLEAVVRVTDRVPGLRIIIDHLPALLWRVDGQARSQVEATLRELARAGFGVRQDFRGDAHGGRQSIHGPGGLPDAPGLPVRDFRRGQADLWQ